MDNAPFPDRASAGRLLAAEVAKLKPERPVVYALPRGGVPVALPIAEALGAPLDLLMVRKLGVPQQPELAAGAIVDGEVPGIVLNDEIVLAARLSEAEIAEIVAAELKVIERRRALYLPDKLPISARDRTAIIVDDGIATGASVRAAIKAIRARQPRRVILAAPVAPPETLEDLRQLVDDIACLRAPKRFGAVGHFYDDFRQVTDEEVVRLLARAPAGGKHKA